MALKTDSHIDRILLKFSANFWNEKSVRFFNQALMVYAFIKLMLTWPVANEVVNHHKMSFPRSVIGKAILLPSHLAEISIHLFYAVFAAFLLLSLFVRSHYIVRLLFFWLTINFVRLHLSITNGSDYVLLMLSMWSVPLATFPLFKNERFKLVQMAVFNLFVILVQLQIVFIYLVSGLDKLQSTIWTSGDAFTYIRQIDTMLNPAFYNLLISAKLNWLFSWLAIGFELYS